MTSTIFQPNDYAGIHSNIIENLPVPIFVRDNAGVFKVCNASFRKITEINDAEVAGKTLFDILSNDNAVIISYLDHEILKGNGSQHYETKLKLLNNIVLDVIVNKVPLKDEFGVITGTIGTIIDVTERIKTQEKLHKAEEDKEIASKLLQKIRAGIVIVDNNLKIIESNLGFARMFGEENEELFETIPGLKGADLEMLVPDAIVKMFQSILESGESIVERDFKHQNKLLNVSIMTIQKNDVAGAIIRDMSAPMLERAEIISRAKQVNRKNMKTVQRIAFLLGENAAQSEELLNSIIESYSYSDEE